MSKQITWAVVLMFLCSCAAESPPRDPPGAPTPVQLDGRYLPLLGTTETEVGEVPGLRFDGGWVELVGERAMFAELPSSTPITVTGSFDAARATLRVEQIDVISRANAWHSVQVADHFGEQRVLTILSNFADTSYSEPTVSDVEEVFFGDGTPSVPSVDAYFRENSYDQTWLSGRVYEHWVQMNSTQHCSWTAWRDEVAQLVDDDVDFTQYDLIVFLAPANSCPFNAFSFAGRFDYASPDGPTRMGFIFGDLAKGGPGYWEDKIDYVLTHEVGHTFGVEHQGTYRCAEHPIDSASNCWWIDHNGKLGPMGVPHLGWPSHFNLSHKRRIGWVEGSLVTVTQSGLYEIQPLECTGSQPAGCVASSLPHGLRVPRLNGGLRSDLYVEFRQHLGFDEILLAAPYGWDQDSTLGADLHTNWGQFSAQLDATVSPSEPADIYSTALLPPADPAAPLDHEVFEDPQSGIVMKTVSVSPEKLVIDVQLGPEVGLGPELELLSPLEGDSVFDEVIVAANASDQSGISSVTLRVGQGADVLHVEELTAAPYTATFTLDPSSRCGEFVASAQAVDGAGYGSFASAPFDVQCADTDGDGVFDVDDNCPAAVNPAQADYDGDQIGDSCDSCVADPLDDADDDGVCARVLGDFVGAGCVEQDDVDYFTSVYGTSDAAADLNSDGVVNLSDLGLFGMQVGECGDLCPDTFDPGQEDADGDGRGDACDFPHLVSSTPQDGATDVASHTSIVLTFDTPIKLATVDATVEPTIALTPSLSSDGRTVTLEHSGLFSFQEHQVTVAAGLQALDGDATPAAIVIDFVCGM